MQIALNDHLKQVRERKDLVAPGHNDGHKDKVPDDRDGD